MYHLFLYVEGLRPVSRHSHATVQCQSQEKDGTKSDICPNTVLGRQVKKARADSMELFVGFVVEVVFMHRSVIQGGSIHGRALISEGAHAWSTIGAL